MLVLACSVAVLSQHSGKLNPGLIPSPGAVCPFGFQTKLASTGFLQGTPVFLLHLKVNSFSLFVSEGPS